MEVTKANIYDLMEDKDAYEKGELSIKIAKILQSNTLNESTKCSLGDNYEKLKFAKVADFTKEELYKHYVQISL